MLCPRLDVQILVDQLGLPCDEVGRDYEVSEMLCGTPGATNPGMNDLMLR